ncbi:MAG: alkylmercury lyase family protein, partial [Gaiellaceae bacterium]
GLDPRRVERGGQVSDGATSPSRTRRQLTVGVATTLAAAGIPASKLGPACRARLSDSERELYVWILRRFATHGRPSGTETREEAARLGAELEDALATLAREDLVHRGPDGEIAVAYPFSGVRTAHRVRFPGGHEAYAMCAIDALGIAPMLEQTIETRSRDPLTGAAFQAKVAPDGTATWEPETAVVVAGALDRQGDSCCGCCPVLNFFVSDDSAQRWLSEHPHVSGQVITIDDAVASGRAVFGDVFQEV